MNHLEMDGTVRRALAAAAGELQATMASLPGWAAAEGAAGARTSDLQRATCNALQSQLGSVACVEAPLPAGVKEHWAGWLGRADVLARCEQDGESYFETQLCGVDKLHESLWDALKLALFTSLAQSRRGYLLYLAPETAWAREGHSPDAIFDGCSLPVGELLRERYRELWSWCLSGTRTTRPTSLPSELHSERIATTIVRAPTADWELRCVRVHGDAVGGWLQFDSDGWPAHTSPPEPGSQSHEPAADAAEPDVDAEEPDVDAEESDVHAEEPDVHAAEPDVDAAEPDVDAEEPDVHAEEEESVAHAAARGSRAGKSG